MVTACYFFLSEAARRAIAELMPVYAEHAGTPLGTAAARGGTPSPAPDTVYRAEAEFAAVRAFYTTALRQAQAAQRPFDARPAAVATAGGSAFVGVKLHATLMGCSEYEARTREEQMGLATWAYGVALLREGLDRAGPDECQWARATGAFKRAAAVFFLLSRTAPRAGDADYRWDAPELRKAHIAVAFKHVAFALVHAMQGNAELATLAATSRYASPECIASFKSGAGELVAAARAVANVDGVDPPPPRLLAVVRSLRAFADAHANIHRAANLCIADHRHETTAMNYLAYIADYPEMAHVREPTLEILKERRALARRPASTNPIAAALRAVANHITDAHVLPPYTGKPVHVAGYPWYDTLRQGAPPPRTPPAN